MTVKTKKHKIIGVIHIDFIFENAILTLTNGRIAKVKIDEIKEIQM